VDGGAAPATDGGEDPTGEGAGPPPRAIGVGPIGASRAVSAPPTDPLSLIERDGGLSVKLSDGHQLWMFADTAVVLNGTMTYFSGRGSGAISVGADPYTITEPWVQYGYIVHPSSPLIAGGAVSCPAGQNDLYWPMSAVAIPQSNGGDTVYVYYQALCGYGADQGSYTTVTMGLARYDYHPSRPPSVANPIRATVVNPSIFGTMPGHSGPGPGYGTTSMFTRGMIYTYGCTYSPVWQLSCRVARVSPSAAASASSYRFWNGSGWVAGEANAADVDLPNAIIGIKGSVAYIASVGLYALVDNDFPSERLAVRWALDPEGPWSVPSFVSVPDCVGRGCRAAEVHGGLSGRSLAISYYADGMRPGMRAVEAPILVGAVGQLDDLSSTAPNQLVATGWATDPDTTEPIDVHVYVDGVMHTATRADLVRSRPSESGHGYRVVIDNLPVGAHQVCVYGIHVGLGADNDQVACRTVDVVVAVAPVAATDATGRMVLVASDGRGELVRRAQVTPGGAWGPWVTTGIESRTTPVFARNQDGRLEVFATDRAGGLVHQWETSPGGSWSAWRWTGVFAIGRPAVGVAPDGRLELFVRDPRGGLIHQWQVAPNSIWSAWQFEGVFLSEDPAVAPSSDGRLELFAVDPIGGLIQRWQVAPNGIWSAWHFTGNFVKGSVALASAPDGRLELFAIDRSGQLTHRWQVRPNGTWSNWFNRGTAATGTPVIVANADTRLQLLLTDPSGWLITSSQTMPNGPWRSWSNLGLRTRFEPGASLVGGKVVVVAVNDGDGRLRMATQTGTTWSGWTQLN
jgi:hypothetical protein